MLCASIWDAHGVPAMTRLHALRHLRCDASRVVGVGASGASDGADGGGARPNAAASATPHRHHDRPGPHPPSAASAEDTATALAMLAAHASACHGPLAAAATLKRARARFEASGRARSNHPALAAASKLAALAPASSAVDAEASVEAHRARAAALLCAGRFEECRAVAAAQLARCREIGGLTRASARLSLLLAECWLAAGSPAVALQHALRAEHLAATLRLDAIRAAAIVSLAEIWLAMSVGHVGHAADQSGATACPYAALAKRALDAHAPALLSRGGLALRARARLAAARATLATTTPEALRRDPAAAVRPVRSFRSFLRALWNSRFDTCT